MKESKQLSDIKKPSVYMNMAMENGVKTLIEYEHWLNGYSTGYETRQKEVLTATEKALKKLKEENVL